MERIYKSTADMVGNTPLMELGAIEEKYGLKARILAKLEYFEPAGSVKDRVAVQIIKDAEEKGLLHQGDTIVEATSGNTGIALCAFAVPRGYKVTIVMPENMSEERKKLIKAYGGDLVLTPKEKGVTFAIETAERIAKETGALQAGQFVNEMNPYAHFAGTGPEIWRDTDGNVDCFIAGVGTGGTLTGTGKYLRSVNPKVRVIAVEPAGSAILSGGEDGPHVIEGIGDGIIPDVLDTGLYNEVITVTDEDALRLAYELASLEGLLVGISSGANLDAAIRLAKRPEYEGKTIVAMFADGGSRYFSTRLFG